MVVKISLDSHNKELRSQMLLLGFILSVTKRALFQQITNEENLIDPNMCVTTLQQE